MVVGSANAGIAKAIRERAARILEIFMLPSNPSDDEAQATMENLLGQAVLSKRTEALHALMDSHVGLALSRN